MEHLFSISNKLITGVNPSFRRSLFNKIDWSQRLIEIKGSRGVGKTTLMLQKAQEIVGIHPNRVLYVSLDDAFFYNSTLFETAKKFNLYGGKYLFVDEVHKYPAKQKQHDWSSELKNIYDMLPELSVTFSGSSIIGLYKGNGDLSRRKSSYNLNGLSFREYLQFTGTASFDTVTLETLLQNQLIIANDITAQLKILPHFRNYLHHGYYPFFAESIELYFQRIKSVIGVILEVDIPTVLDINHETIGKIKKMLAVLATSVPYTPNLTQLSANLNIADLRTLYRYFSLLENAELVQFLNSNKDGNKIFQKPEKIFLNNTNLAHALAFSNIEMGTVRETFFLNQVNQVGEISYPPAGDFLVHNKYIFEVGGKSKKNKQIRETANSYIVIDDAEVGFGNRIPLWLFGFLY